MPNFSKRTHCLKRGHLLTPDNLYTLVRPNGSVRRACKRCKLDGDHARNKKRRQEREPKRRGRPRRYAKAHKPPAVESNPFASDYEYGREIRRKKDAERDAQRKQLMSEKREQWARMEELGISRLHAWWLPKLGDVA